VERRSKKKHTASASASITQAKNHQFLKGKRRTRRRASEPILTTLTKMKNRLMRLHNPTLVPEKEIEVKRRSVRKENTRRLFLLLTILK
jgi:hypothetical protein